MGVAPWSPESPLVSSCGRCLRRSVPTAPSGAGGRCPSALGPTCLAGPLALQGGGLSAPLAWRGHPHGGRDAQAGPGVWLPPGRLGATGGSPDRRKAEQKGEGGGGGLLNACTRRWNGYHPLLGEGACLRWQMCASCRRNGEQKTCRVRHVPILPGDSYSLGRSLARSGHAAQKPPGGK